MRHLFLLPLALTVVLVSLVTAEPPTRALAQDASPPATATGTLRTTLDLAAMALTADELPPGFRRGNGDTYTPGNLYGIVFAPHVSNEHLLAAGFLRNYEAYYDAIDEQASISVDIDEYATPEGAVRSSLPGGHAGSRGGDARGARCAADGASGAGGGDGGHTCHAHRGGARWRNASGD